jgi:hypothetical protein
MPELMATVDRVRWALERTENEGFALYTVAMLKTHQPKDDKQTYPRWWGNLSYFVMRRAYSQYDGDSSLRIVGPYLDEFIPIALEETERRLEGRAVWSGGYEGLLLDYLKYKPESPIRQRLDSLARQYAKVPPGAPNGDRQIRHRLSVAWGMLLSLEIIHDGMTVSEVTDLLGEPTTRVAGHVSWNYETGSRAKEYGIDGKVSSNGERETIEFTNVDRWKH